MQAMDDEDDATSETPEIPDIVRRKRTAANDADFKINIMMK